MNTNDALTTTATQVETILTHHSVTYTTTDNRGKEEDDYRITVGDVTAYLTASDDDDVWATTDENPADAYDGPANVDEIALHLMNYAAEVPAVVSVIAAVMNETAGDANVSYWDGYWEVEDSHTDRGRHGRRLGRDSRLTSTGSTGAATRVRTLPLSSRPGPWPTASRSTPSPPSSRVGTTRWPIGGHRRGPHRPSWHRRRRGHACLQLLG